MRTLVSLVLALARPGWQQGDVALSDHVVSVVQLQLVLPLQVDRHVLFVGEPLLTHRALEPVLYSALETHVPVEIVVPAVTFPTLLALELLLLFAVLGTLAASTSTSTSRSCQVFVSPSRLRWSFAAAVVRKGTLLKKRDILRLDFSLVHNHYITHTVGVNDSKTLI